MPFKAVEHPKCPKCGKSVYAAEERLAGGLKFHNDCFKCEKCTKKLDSTLVNEREGKLYCKNCYSSCFGPAGFRGGSGGGSIQPGTESTAS